MNNKEVIGYTAVPLEQAKLLLQQQKQKAKYNLYTTDGILGKGMYFSIGNLDYAKYQSKLNNQVIIKARLSLERCIDTLNGEHHLIIANIHKKLLGDGKQITATTLYNAVAKQYKEKMHSIRGISLFGRVLNDFNNQAILYEYQSIILCVLDSNCILDISGQNN